jgi:hypothetical protein
MRCPLSHPKISAALETDNLVVTSTDDDPNGSHIQIVVVSEKVVIISLLCLLIVPFMSLLNLEDTAMFFHIIFILHPFCGDNY